MNFNVFKAGRNKSEISEGLQHHDIGTVVANTPHDQLEDFVLDNFHSILIKTHSYQFHHFKKFESWRELFVTESQKIFEAQTDFCDFEDIIKNFPELEADVYAFLLDDIIHSEPEYELRSQISIAEDLLIPMAHMESYCGVYFPQVRALYKEIIESTISYHDFHAVIAALEIYYDIPTKELEAIVKENIDKEIELWLENKGKEDDFYTLIEFFYSSEAYDCFMKKLYDIFAVHGLDLYKFLIEKIGPKAEILEHEYDCYEFHSK